MEKIIVFLIGVLINLVVYCQISMNIEEDTIYIPLTPKKYNKIVLVPITIKLQLEDISKKYVLYNFKDFAKDLSDGDGLFLLDSIKVEIIYYNKIIKYCNICLDKKKQNLIFCDYINNFKINSVYLDSNQNTFTKKVYMFVNTNNPKIVFYNNFEKNKNDIRNTKLVFQQSKEGAHIYLHYDTINSKNYNLFLGNIYSDSVTVVLLPNKEIRKIKNKQKVKKYKILKGELGRRIN